MSNKVIGGKAPFRTALLMVAMFAGTVAPLAARADNGGEGGDGGNGGYEYYGEGNGGGGGDDKWGASPVRAAVVNRNTPKTTADGARYFKDAVDVPDSVQVIGSRSGPTRFVRAVVPTAVAIPVVTSPPVAQQLPPVDVPVADYGDAMYAANDGSDRVDMGLGDDPGNDAGDTGDSDSGSDGE
jgi:hypothetical protein